MVIVKLIQNFKILAAAVRFRAVRFRVETTTWQHNDGDKLLFQLKAVWLTLFQRRLGRILYGALFAIVSRFGRVVLVKLKRFINENVGKYAKAFDSNTLAYSVEFLRNNERQVCYFLRLYLRLFIFAFKIIGNGQTYRTIKMLS